MAKVAIWWSAATMQPVADRGSNSLASGSLQRFEKHNEVREILSGQLLAEAGRHDRDHARAHFFDFIARNAHRLRGGLHEDKLLGSLIFQHPVFDAAIGA